MDSLNTGTPNNQSEFSSEFSLLTFSNEFLHKSIKKPKSLGAKVNNIKLKGQLVFKKGRTITVVSFQVFTR